MIIYGIDPGLNHYACSIVDWNKDKIKLLDIRSFDYDPQRSLEHKLKLIYQEIEKITYEYCPDVVSIEAQFFGQNVRTLRSLCESVGVMKVSILNNTNAKVRDFSPAEMKQALTGKGNANKEAMISSAENLFGIDLSSDEADSIGAVMAYILFGGNETFIDMISPFVPEKNSRDLLLFTKEEKTKKERDKFNAIKKKVFSIVESECMFRYEVNSLLKEKGGAIK